MGPSNPTVGRVRPGEPLHNVFHNVGSLGQTRPTWFMVSMHAEMAWRLPMNRVFRTAGPLW